MADNQDTGKKRRQLKKQQTVRERANKAGVEKKPRRISRAGTTVAKPLRHAGGGLRAIFRPLRFVLWPFKRRPVRFIGRLLRKVLLFSYFRGAWEEVRQVKWPKGKETAKLTFAVFMFAIFFMAIITLADFGLDKVFKQLILK